MQLVSRGTGLAAAALCCGLALTGCGGVQARRASHMERGERYLADGNLQKAQIEFRNALQIDPNSAETRVMIGRVEEQLGDLRQAAGMYQSAIDLSPDDVPAHARLGRLYVLHGAAARALKLIEPALRRHPGDADLLTVRGMARAALKDPAAARADAERAVKSAPGNEDAVALLASLDVQDNELGRAVDLVRAALSRLPSSVRLRQILADLYTRLHESQLAEAQLAQVVALRPKDLSLRYRLALFYVGVKRLGDAERVFRDAITLHPDEDSTKLAYVQFLLQYRSPADAERALAGFLRRHADDDELLLALGTVKQREGDLEGALSAYRHVVADAGEHPQGLTARNRIAVILAAQGRSDQASRLITEVLRDNPRDDDALLLRGNIAMDRKDPASAIVDLRAVLRDQPRSLPILQALARAYWANGQAALAEETLRSALDLAPGDAGTCVELAQLLAGTNRSEAAFALLKQTLKAQPDAVTALQALARLDIERGRGREAVDRVRSVAESEPSNAALQNLLGGVYLAVRDYPSAIATLRRAIELASKWGAPYRNLASAQAASGDNAGATRTYEQALVAVGLEPALVSDLATLYEREGRIDDAIRQYEALYRSNPQLPFAANNLAMLLVTYRTDQASLERARDLTSGFLDSDSADLLDTAGWVRLKCGEIAQALPALEEAAARAPQSRVIRYHLGMAQLQAGQRDQARSSLESALAGAARFAGWEDARSALASLEPRPG